MKKSVLLVDDFENSLFVTALTIESAGYNVHKVASAKKALEIIKSNTPIDLIITDYNMPEMNGLQFVKEIKTIPSVSQVPIFILTTESKEEVRKAALAEGVTLWIRKPFKAEQLVEYVNRTIGQ
jgi:two-component system, chemotaxis family, chemotaxis protein CheY